MSVVKALLGGMVGGTLGAFLAELISGAVGGAGPWWVLLGGLFAGAGARASCGHGRSYATGVATAIAALLAISLVGRVTSQRVAASAQESMSRISVPQSVPASPSKDKDSPDEGSVEIIEPSVDPQAGSAADPPMQPQSEEPAPEPPLSSDTSGRSVDLSFPQEPRAGDPVDALPVSMAIAHGLAALLAFLLGSGTPVSAEQE